MDATDTGTRLLALVDECRIPSHSPRPRIERDGFAVVLVSCHSDQQGRFLALPGGMLLPGFIGVFFTVVLLVEVPPWTRGDGGCYRNIVLVIVPVRTST